MKKMDGLSLGGQFSNNLLSKYIWNQTNYNDLIRNGQQFNKMENDLWPQIIEHKKYHADRNPDSGFEQQQEQKCGRELTHG
jgi:hypothetical protein